MQCAEGRRQQQSALIRWLWGLIQLCIHGALCILSLVHIWNFRICNPTSVGASGSTVNVLQSDRPFRPHTYPPPHPCTAQRQWMNATLDIAAAIEHEPLDMLATIAAPKGRVMPSKMRVINDLLPAARYGNGSSATGSTGGSKGGVASTGSSADGPKDPASHRVSAASDTQRCKAYLGCFAASTPPATDCCRRHQMHTSVHRCFGLLCAALIPDVPAGGSSRGGSRDEGG